MGFYGNIVNTNKTQFIFDKTYSNRYEMDSAVDTDGVFVGRFVLVDYDTPEGEYNNNYSIDKNAYSNMGRPYDSTVWQKTYTNGQNKYVMIAELNAVVPTFDLVADPPTLSHKVPYFDKDSTNVYYKLHMPTQWKVQIKEAETKEISDVPNLIVSGLVERDGEIGQDSKTYPADIYFGKSFFEASNFAVAKNAPIEDSIKLTPASSGYEYSDSLENEQLDIQELSIHLPSLGKAISNMWDLVYGPAFSIDGTNYIRNTDIYWGNTSGYRLTFNEDYAPEYMGTVAGCINSIHDLMGQIITNVSGKTVEEENASEWYDEEAENEHIYVFSKGDNVGFYMIEKNPDHLVPIDNNLEDWLTNRYDELYVYKDTSGKLNPGAKWRGTDQTGQWPENIQLGYKEISYEWVELEGFARNLNTIHGLILKVNHILRSGDIYTRDTTTVQGCINSLNDIINYLEKLDKNCFIISNNNGQLEAAGIHSDAWVNLKVQDGDITIGHNEAKEAASALPIKEVGLSYSSTTPFPYPVFDKKGHYVTTNNITLKSLPMPPITIETSGADEGKVITYIEKHPNKDGELLASISNLADVKIKTLPNNSSLLDGVINEEDTIGEALCKLNNRIAALEAKMP